MPLDQESSIQNAIRFCWGAEKLERREFLTVGASAFLVTTIPNTACANPFGLRLLFRSILRGNRRPKAVSRTLPSVIPRSGLVSQCARYRRTSMGAFNPCMFSQNGFRSDQRRIENAQEVRASHGYVFVPRKLLSRVVFKQIRERALEDLLREDPDHIAVTNSSDSQITGVTTNVSAFEQSVSLTCQSYSDQERLVRVGVDIRHAGIFSKQANLDTIKHDIFRKVLLSDFFRIAPGDTVRVSFALPEFQFDGPYSTTPLAYSGDGSNDDGLELRLSTEKLYVIDESDILV